MITDSDSDDDILMFMMYKIIKKRKKRRLLCMPYTSGSRSEEGEYFKLIPVLKSDDERFQDYYKMTRQTYNKLLESISPFIDVKHNSFKRAVSVDERLTITLRFLATGDTFRSMASRFCMAHNTISNIVKNMCSVIWEALNNDYMKVPDTMRWNQIADEFMIKNQFPNCLGAVDGRHVKIRCPHGEVYYGTKGYPSIEVMAVIDSNYMFIIVDVGLYGKFMDGCSIDQPPFVKMISQEAECLKLNVPENQPLSSNSKIVVPFVFVGEKTFKLTDRMMKPYSQKELTDLKSTVFNNRLYRAAQVADYAFGMLVHRWRVFEKQIMYMPEKVDFLIKAACVLHNFIRTYEEDIQNENLDEVLGYSNCLPSMFQNNSIDSEYVNESSSSIRVREMFADFFMSSEGAVIGQEERRYIIDENI